MVPTTALQFSLLLSKYKDLGQKSSTEWSLAKGELLTRLSNDVVRVLTAETVVCLNMSWTAWRVFLESWTNGTVARCAPKSQWSKTTTVQSLRQLASRRLTGNDPQVDPITRGSGWEPLRPLNIGPSYTWKKPINLSRTPVFDCGHGYVQEEYDNVWHEERDVWPRLLWKITRQIKSLALLYNHG